MSSGPSAPTVRTVNLSKSRSYADRSRSEMMDGCRDTVSAARAELPRFDA